MTTTEPALADDFDAACRQCRSRVAQALDRVLPAGEGRMARLHEAMRYAVLNGGKRVRAMLVYWSGGALGASPETLDAPAAAVELVHAYSLVHDDLPCMDDDDLRRGVPTCHRAFDEATALLCGDALQTLAFEVLADPGNGLDAAQRSAMVATLATASGSLGMAGGQAIDLAAVGGSPDLEHLEDMHLRKTGALIRAAARMGALAAPATGGDDLERLDEYARCIGLAFQIQDDILDVEGDTATLGKTRGADVARGKPTYPSLLGLDGARAKAAALHERALETLSPYDAAADPLRRLATFIVERRS